MTKNTQATRYVSNLQEQSVCRALGATQTSNSGAGHFRKGDAVNKSAGLLIECKTAMQDKSTFSIKKEWIEKNREECFTQRLPNSCIAFSFGPSSSNYYVIDEKLMKFLVEKLQEDTENS